MEKKRILYVSQEIHPYLPENELSKKSLELPKSMNESGYEVRVFMPRYGCINERRHQLHEVIRLSGMNLIINDMDQPLIIKVASVPSARMQVYFIDNEEYFKRKTTLLDENKNCFADNDERALFFCRGVMETVKKLGWTPDIIHCHGWMTSMLPMYLKKAYNDDPVFSESKIVFSVYDNAFNGELNSRLVSNMEQDGFTAEELSAFKGTDFVSLNNAAIAYSDGVIKASNTIDSDIESFATEQGIPTLEYTEEADAYQEFYNSIIVEETVA